MKVPGFHPSSVAQLLDADHGVTSAGRLKPAQLHTHALHPLTDRLQRKDDVDGLAGAPLVLPQYVPIDFLQIPIAVRSLEDAVEALRYCDRLCTLIAVQVITQY